MRISGLVALVSCLLFAPAAGAQDRPRTSAAVEIDGEVLFQVRGIEARPAAERAADIESRIAALAADRSFDPDTLRTEDRGPAIFILAGSLAVMGLDDEDARLEGVQRSLLAALYADRIRQAIVAHREARTGTRLVAGAARAAAAVAIAGGLLWLVLWLLRRGESALRRGFDKQVETLADESRRILRIERFWHLVRGAFALVRAAAILAIVVLLLQYVLVQFPWSRGAGLRLFEYIWRPLAAAGESVVAAIPSLVLLTILFLATRYGLSLAHLYFESVQAGSIRLHNFEPEWALPTYNLVRVAAIAFALVVAYPLIPGSGSDAFKGLSLLAGVMLSLGSTTAMANMVAGYMLVYRRAFRIGDIVKIGEVVGRVSERRLQVTHIHTVKNEEITIPNSVILGSEVTNYSRPAHEGRLILHTEVGIGYETPWRQVEALLVEAARRTPGLLTEPPPFVLQQQLGDFAITYQINAYCNRPGGFLQIRTDLHRHILDLFNEHGVQIMTPAYEGDPEQPKIVAKEHWYAPPAPKDDP